MKPWSIQFRRIQGSCILLKSWITGILSFKCQWRITIVFTSLLLGIHNETVEAESRDKEEKKSIDSEGSTVTLRGSRKRNSQILTRFCLHLCLARDRSKHISLNPTTLQNILAKSARPERFQIAADPWGGIPATNSNGDKLKIYLGIIDILQCYKSKKKHFRISCK